LESESRGFKLDYIQEFRGATVINREFEPGTETEFAAEI
jgi:hypothetical protein